MMIFFVILYTLATLLLSASITGTVLSYKIPVTMNFVLSSLIGLGGIFAGGILAVQSLSHFLVYGAAVALFMVILTTIGKAKFWSGMISSIMSFFFWPQYIVFTIFTILHVRTYMEKDG